MIHERVTSSGKEKEIVGIEEGLFWGRKEVLDTVCDVVCGLPVKHMRRAEGKWLWEERWCYEEEGIKDSALGLESRDETEQGRREKKSDKQKQRGGERGEKYVTFKG